jgi:hypothetical protein
MARLWQKGRSKINSSGPYFISSHFILGEIMKVYSQGKTEQELWRMEEALGQCPRCAAIFGAHISDLEPESEHDPDPDQPERIYKSRCSRCNLEVTFYYFGEEYDRLRKLADDAEKSAAKTLSDPADKLDGPQPRWPQPHSACPPKPMLHDEQFGQHESSRDCGFCAGPDEEFFGG